MDGGSAFRAPQHSASDQDAGDNPAGVAYLLNGPLQGEYEVQDADATLEGFHTGGYTGGNAGWAVEGGGDFNGDGFDDVVVGAPIGGANGNVFLVFGPVSGTLSLSFADGRFWGEDFGSAGCAIAFVGDTNGDGFDDLLIGAYEDEGEAYLVYGRP